MEGDERTGTRECSGIFQSASIGANWLTVGLIPSLRGFMQLKGEVPASGATFLRIN